MKECLCRSVEAGMLQTAWMVRLTHNQAILPWSVLAAILSGLQDAYFCTENVY